MDTISTSRNRQPSHGYTGERSLAKTRGSELGDTQEQASPVGMPQTAKEIYYMPLALRDWWILNVLWNWYLLFFTASPRPSPDQPQQDSPESTTNPQSIPATGSTITVSGSNNSGIGNVSGSYNTTNNNTAHNNQTYNNAEKIYGGGKRNDFSGATFH